MIFELAKWKLRSSVLQIQMLALLAIRSKPCLAFHPKRQDGVHLQIVIRNSDLDEPWLGFRRQSLKSLRRVEMARAWRDGMGFERNK